MAKFRAESGRDPHRDCWEIEGILVAKGVAMNGII